MIAIFRVACTICSKPRNPKEVIKLPGGVTVCWRCYDWHQKALLALATGVPPAGCQECGTPFADLQAVDNTGNVPMAMHVKDGVYQILCLSCSDVYERKRRDLYGGTLYGARKGIC